MASLQELMRAASLAQGAPPEPAPTPTQPTDENDYLAQLLIALIAGERMRQQNGSREYGLSGLFGSGPVIRQATVETDRNPYVTNRTDAMVQFEDGSWGYERPRPTQRRASENYDGTGHGRTMMTDSRFVRPNEPYISQGFDYGSSGPVMPERTGEEYRQADYLRRRR